MDRSWTTDMATPTTPDHVPHIADPKASSLAAIMKASFSMSSLRDSVAHSETELTPPATLPRRKSQQHERRRRAHKHDDDNRNELWAALKPSYDYIMDDGLIKTCREANRELSWDEDEMSTESTWTYQEFLEQLHDLRACLEHLDGKVSDLEGVDVRHLEDEMLLFADRLAHFNEQAEWLASRQPPRADEICQKSEHLNTQWAALQLCVATPGGSQDEGTALRRDIACQMRLLRKWIRGIEEQLGPVHRNAQWTTQDLEEKLKHHQVLHKEIESRGKSVLTVVKLCQRFCLQQQRHLVESGGDGNVGSEESGGVQQYTDGASDGERTLRAAVSLQDRFHGVWLLSLEWQCWLEALLAGGLPPSHSRDDSFDFGSPGGDEPINKFPRLVGEAARAQPGMGDRPITTPAARLTTNKSSRRRRDLASCLLTSTPSVPITNTTTLETTSTNTTTTTGSQSDTEMVLAGHLDDDVDVIRPSADHHHDVGYSSESSAHLSNEEEGSSGGVPGTGTTPNEFARIYTYTSAEAKSPRVLEVVVDGDRRPRRTPPRDTDGVVTSASVLTQDSATAVVGTTPNCGTFYFYHEDSTTASESESRSTKTGGLLRHRRSRLDFGGSGQESLSSAASGSETFPRGGMDGLFDTTASETSDDDQMPERARLPDGIHRLVAQAEMLVKCGEPVRIQPPVMTSGVMPPNVAMVDSSCDASGEYTSSNESEDGDQASSVSSSSSSDEDRNGSVIHLQLDSASDVTLSSSSSQLPPRVPAVGGGTATVTTTAVPTPSAAAISVTAAATAATGGGGGGSGGVTMRTKKRRSGDRPWSVVELNQRTQRRLDLSPFSNSETALNHLAAAANAPRSTSSPVRRPRRHTVRRGSTKRTDSGSEDKCRSLCSLRHSSSSENGRWKSNSCRSQQLSPPQSDRAEQTTTVGEDGSARAGSNASDTDDGVANVCADSDRSPRSPICSPPPALDEFSSMSEQAWDSYQESPYLSEAYSEHSMDEDSVRKLMEFGDDYRAFIESHSDGTSTPSLPALSKIRHRLTSNRQVASGRCQRDSAVLDSESDLDDVNDVIEQHTQQLQVTEAFLKEQRATDPSEPGRANNISEVLATCHTNIVCLRKVWNELCAVQLTPSTLNDDVHQAGVKLHRNWERLLMEAEEYKRQLQQLGQLQKEVKSLQAKVGGVLQQLDNLEERIVDRHALEELRQTVQDQLQLLNKVRPMLVKLNFEIHNFVTSSGLDVAHLKNDVVGLYCFLDNTRESVEEKRSQLNGISAIWEEYDQARDHLRDVLQQDKGTLTRLSQALEHPAIAHIHTHSPWNEILNVVSVSELKEKILGEVKVELVCSAVDGVATEGVADEEDAQGALKALAAVAARAETVMGKSCPMRKELSAEAGDMARDVERQQNECRELVLRTAAFLERQQLGANHPLKLSPETESFRHRRAMDKQTGSSERVGAGVSPAAKSSRSLLWRVIRAALPIQLAVVILFCFACLFEPHCCDSVNNLNMSLSPQLRYIRGPPPV